MSENGAFLTSKGVVLVPCFVQNISSLLSDTRKYSHLKAEIRECWPVLNTLESVLQWDHTSSHKLQHPSACSHSNMRHTIMLTKICPMLVINCQNSCQFIFIVDKKLIPIQWLPKWGMGPPPPRKAPRQPKQREENMMRHISLTSKYN